LQFLLLFSNNFANTIPVFSSQHVSSVALKSMHRGDTASVLCLLMLLRHLLQTSNEYHSLLTHSSQLMSKYNDITTNMQSSVSNIGAIIYNEFIEYVKIILFLRFRNILFLETHHVDE